MTPQPTYPSEGFLLDEDRALRDLMKGIVVSDNENQTRAVEAWFGHPDLELREQKYPYITVDLLEITEGIDRVHRGDLFLASDDPLHPPEWWGYPDLAPNHLWVTEMPTPVDLHYQIGTWARHPRHDREILRSLITGGRTSLRAGVLKTADGFYRRVDYMGHIKRDREESGKRLFNNVFRLRISSEVPFGVLEQVRRTESVHVNLRTRADRPLSEILDSGTVHGGKVLSWDGSTLTASVEIMVEGALQTLTDVPVVNGITSLDVDELVVVDQALSSPIIMQSGKVVA